MRSAVLIGLLTLAACAAAPSPRGYTICNTAGCGDNVDITISNNAS